VNAANLSPPHDLGVEEAETDERPWDHADVADVALDDREASS